MNMDSPKTRFLRKLNERRGWIIVARLIFCCIAGVLNGIDLGFQGNGNLILSGVFLGLVLGLAWSTLFLFGLLPFAQRFHPSVQAALWGISLLLALTSLAICCFHIWERA